MRFSLAACVLTVAVVCGCIQASASAERVEEAGFINIGGIDQWVTIRGDDNHPLLLLLHGGPGDVQSTFISSYEIYEEDYLLVQWDQRGAGRTFAASGAADITLENQIADGIELAGLLRKRFPEQPLVLFGHSWGSIVATGMALQRPDLFQAYVGTGQVAAWADTVQFQFDFLKQRYQEYGNSEGLAALEAIGTPDPRDVAQYFSFSRDLRQYMHPSHVQWFADMRRLAKENGETEATLKTISDGMNASGAALLSTLVTIDLPATASAFELSYFVIQGRHDVSAPTPLAEAYFAKVSAPRKQMVILEDAGHFALVTHQQEVLAALRQLLR